MLVAVKEIEVFLTKSVTSLNLDRHLSQVYLFKDTENALLYGA